MTYWKQINVWPQKEKTFDKALQATSDCLPAVLLFILYSTLFLSAMIPMSLRYLFLGFRFIKRMFHIKYHLEYAERCY